MPMMIFAAIYPPYHLYLLEDAQRRIDAGEHNIALILCMTACEVITEQVMTALLKHKGVAELAEPLGKALPNFNITRPDVMRLYDALAGESIKRELRGSWRDLERSSQLRNSAVHTSHRVAQAEAETSLASAQALVTHLNAVLKRLAQANA